MDTSGEQKVFVPSTVFYLSLAVQNTDNNFCGRGEDDALVFFTVMMALLAVDELRCARDGCRAALPPKSWTRIDLLRAFAWRSCAVSCPAFCGGTDLEGCLSKTAAVVAASRSAYRTMIADLKHLWAPTIEDAECIAHVKDTKKALSCDCLFFAIVKAIVNLCGHSSWSTRTSML
ncbi:hypothetical protein PC123_g20750 [Phytophthora cactorum]|nr:hypothetical protein PC123_g20750 [Phytophthora cactorum]